VVGAVEVVVATCPCKCRPSLECHGDVGDGMVKDPSSCGGRAIPCCHRMGVVLFVDWRRSRPGQDVAEGVDEEWIIPSPRKPRTRWLSYCASRGHRRWNSARRGVYSGRFLPFIPRRVVKSGI
jgi:hypothetical protein